MSITTREYYTGLISIGNADAKEDRALLGNSDVLGGLIAQYEREVMIQLFGWSLCKDFISNLVLDAKGVYQLKTGVDVKWDELLNGKEYEVDGIPVVWRGLRFEDVKIGDNVPRSLLAYYIYAQYITQDETQHSGIGLVKNKAKNAVNISGRVQYVIAWNIFIKMAVSCNESYGERSLYQFIEEQNKQNSNHYPNWHPFEFKTTNRFGI